MNFGKPNVSNRYARAARRRHALYSSFDEEDEEEILPLKRESVLDYLDEEEE